MFINLFLSANKFVPQLIEITDALLNLIIIQPVFQNYNIFQRYNFLKIYPPK